MSDFKNDLRRYIDGLERPLSVQETMSRQQERRRFRAPAAVLAGAAIVMIPAMVLIGIRFFPGDDGDVAQTTAPAISETSTTVTASTTTTTGAPSSLVTVPDIVGLPLDRAEEVLASLGLRLEVVEMRPSSEFTGISAQEPVGSTSVAAGSTVIVDVYVPPTCVADDAEIRDGSMGVTVLFQCGTSRYPDISFPITRAVSEGNDVIAATLRALLAGPTETERANGYESFFSPESSGALNSAVLENGRLTVDFNDDILIGNASTSNGSLFFMAELQANLFQFEDIDSIEFQLNGSCDAFFGWLQGECQDTTRGGWDRQLAGWDREQEVDNPPQVGVEEISPSGVVASAILTEAYAAENLIDGNLETTWQASSFEDTLILEFRWTQPVQINYIEIYNISADLEFLRNYRIQSYSITVDDLPGVELRNTLSDQAGGPQRIDIASIETQVLTLEVLGSYPSSAVAGNAPFSELAVAEVRFFGVESP